MAQELFLLSDFISIYSGELQLKGIPVKLTVSLNVNVFNPFFLHYISPLCCFLLFTLHIQNKQVTSTSDLSYEFGVILSCSKFTCT